MVVISQNENEIDNNRIGNAIDYSNIQFGPGVLYPVQTKDFFQFSLENNSFSLLRNYSDAVLFSNTVTSSRFLFSPFNYRVTQPGLGYYNNIGVSSMWIPVDKLFIEGSIFISLQNTLYSGEILYGANGILNYNFTDKMQLKLWGQFVSPSNNDPLKIMSGIYPRTSIGSAVVVEPAKNLKVGAGVEYQQNQKQKWESHSGGKVSFGF